MTLHGTLNCSVKIPYGAVVGGEGGLIRGNCPLLTFGAGLDSAGTGPVGVVGPSGDSSGVGICSVVVVVVLAEAPVFEL